MALGSDRKGGKRRRKKGDAGVPGSGRTKSEGCDGCGSEIVRSDVKIIGEKGLSGVEKAAGDRKFLEVINALLTTTGCGSSPQRPQRMGTPMPLVNRLVAKKCVNFYVLFGLRTRSQDFSG